MTQPRRERQGAILRLIRERQISTQAELADALRADGFDVVQTTVSRDIAELGLVKVRAASGALVYKQQGTADLDRLRELEQAFRRWALSIEASDALVVVFTPRGFSAALGDAIDESNHPHVLATVAGENTILVVPVAGVSAADPARGAEQTPTRRSSMSKTAVLAYSGGLDTTCIIAWLKEFYDYDEVVAVLCDVGQEFDLEQSQERGYAAGADDVLLVDRREAFANDAVRAGAEDERAVRGQVPARLRALAPGDRAGGRRARAQELGAEAAVHGCTGKGNDQLRFELAFRANYPGVRVIAPLRDKVWTRDEEIEYAQSQGHPDHRHEELAVLVRREPVRPLDRGRRCSRTRGRRRRRSRTCSPPTRTPRRTRSRS